MAAYVRYRPTWNDWPDTSTPAGAAFYKGVEDALVNTLNKTPSASSDNIIVPVGNVTALGVGDKASTDPGPDTGTPPGNYFPIKFIDTYGTPGVDITQTQQQFVGWRTYKERTVDDSAEAASWGVILTSAFGGFANPQAKPVVGFEGIAISQGTVAVNSKHIGLVGSSKIQGTAHADTLINIYSSGAQVAAGASVGDVFALYLESSAVLGSQSGHSWSIHAPEDARFLKSVVIGSSSITAAQVFIQNRASSADPALAIAAGTGQTGNTFETRDANNNKLWIVDVAGLPQWVAAANQQTTVGAAGGASALPASPTAYLKVKNSAGTTLVIPAYAA